MATTDPDSFQRLPCHLPRDGKLLNSLALPPSFPIRAFTARLIHSVMPLTPPQIEIFRTAIDDYAFPPAYFDFKENKPVKDLTMVEVEAQIRRDLLSHGEVKDGLSNIVRWGFAQRMGRAEFRVARFRSSVTAHQLEAAWRLFSSNSRPALLDIKQLGLPEFSGVSFVSKVRMFLDPEKSATLDLQIMKTTEHRASSVLSTVKAYSNRIPVTKTNSDAYEAWCARLASIRDRYLNGLRVVDIERGLFHLIQTGRTKAAADILADA
ncbi:hypothetical protein [Paraburkholderia sp. SIMBA_054]|uniref:hypothetical protein n=1 Tax=Paraburkholderia sp. SIMBA_054 TaxID=3085795 RepID=UPI00397BE2EC